MKFNQKGFGVIEILLAVIAVTLIAGIALYAFSELGKSPTDTSKNNADTKVVSSNYIELPDWGVRIKLPDNPNDIYIKDRTLSVHSLDTVDACAADKTGIATVQRYKAGEVYEAQAGTTVSQKDIDDAPLINGYHYLVASGNGTCTDTSNQLWQNARKEILNLSGSIEAVIT